MKNRWFVVLGALIIQVSLGAVYIWSVFQTPLLTHFPAWKETHVTLPAQIILASFALAVILAGRIQDRVGPRPVATAGGLMLGLGLILAKFTASFPSSTALIWLILTYSVLGGLGIGAAYVCPIATCVKWFPDKRGLITGLAVAGFGAGAFFFAPLARGLISGGFYQLFGKNLFRLPEVGLFNTFLVLGVIFLATITLGAIFLKNPEPGYKPAGWNPPAQSVSAASLKVDFSPSEMFRTWQFWLLWGVYLTGCAAGLMIIMKASPIWQSFALSNLTSGLDPAQFNQIASAGALAVSILAIFNSLGRIVWGKISDLAGRKATLLAMFTLCGLTMLFFNSFKNYSLFLIGISLIGLCFGGFLAVFPAVTADFFGTKHYGTNYGWMFSAYGMGGILGPYLAAGLMKTAAIISFQEFDSTGQGLKKSIVVGNYSQAFLVAGVLCLAAAAALTFLKKPSTGKFNFH
ncbi:MAG: OFA family MFS transporter [Candidatus Aminicenantes bacterium]|nr:OFA family MFS transporter [Candidatus Aminicenantes bacterium]